MRALSVGTTAHGCRRRASCTSRRRGAGSGLLWSLRSLWRASVCEIALVWGADYLSNVVYESYCVCHRIQLRYHGSFSPGVDLTPGTFPQ
jgi:hypothetical protein